MGEAILDVVYFTIQIMAMLAVIAIIWAVWGVILPDVYPTGPKSFIDPPFWRFALMWMFFIFIVRILRGWK